MLVLAIDTASQVSSVAVAEEKKLLSEITQQGRLTHSETLLPHIEEALQLAAAKRQDLTAIAVNLGPGSFTGLRIGLAAAKALAYGLEIPLLGIPGGAALAANFPSPGLNIAPLVNAQKGNVYMAVFAWELNSAQLRLKVRRELTVRPLAESLRLCGELDGITVIAGDMAPKILAENMALPARVIVAPPLLMMPRAAGVASLALERLKRGESDDLMFLEPLYIRPSEAEVLWEKRRQNLSSGK